MGSMPTANPCNPPVFSAQQTTKYNPVTFFPRALYEQFSRLGNIYFLLVAILSTTELSPVAPLTTVLPLMLVLGISLTKEGIEDTRRYRGDKKVNESKVLAWRNDQFKMVEWQTIKVGEIVKVTRDGYDPIPPSSSTVSTH